MGGTEETVSTVRSLSLKILSFIEYYISDRQLFSSISYVYSFKENVMLIHILETLAG
jgi:hypothetical protein